LVDMAAIAFDGCVGSYYWVLGLQALLLKWRDSCTVIFFCYLWKVNKNLVVSAVQFHMMSHIMKGPKDKQHSN